MDAILTDCTSGGLVHRFPPVKFGIRCDDPEHRIQPVRIHPVPVFPRSVERVIRDDISPFSFQRAVAHIADSAAGIPLELPLRFTDMAAFRAAFIFFPVDVAFNGYIMMFRFPAFSADTADLFTLIRNRFPLMVSIPCRSANGAPTVFEAMLSGPDFAADAAFFLTFSRNRLIIVTFIPRLAAAFTGAAVPLVSK